jgi:hypothetical protein
MSSSRSDRGQAVVIVVIALVVLLGMAAAVLDVGSWYREDRDLQATVDAAALAGAQELPEDSGAAAALADEFAEKNGGGLAAVTFSSVAFENDVIAVEGEREAPGFFARVLGIDSISVRAAAKARTGILTSARWAAPVAVNELHPMLQCSPPPCAGATQLNLFHLHAPGAGDAAGAFGLIRLDRSLTTNPGADVVAGWLATGFEGLMPLGLYNSVPSAQFNNGQFKAAMQNRIGDELLFPVYRSPIVGSGDNAKYNVVGWAGFRLSGFKATGSTGEIYGSFTRIVWEGVMSETGTESDFGARAVTLIE